MRKPLFIARQGAHPNGLLGHVVAAVMERETSRFNEDVLRTVAIAPGERVLEIGLGHGRTIERAARAETRAAFAGIDASPLMLRRARKRLVDLIEIGRVELLQGDASSLPWPEETFDAAYTVHTIHFIEDLGAVFREVWRVLRPGGRLTVGFREASDETRAALPPEIYRLRSKAEVAQELGNARLDPALGRNERGDETILVAKKVA